MNKAILVGRLTRDPEVKFTENNLAVTRFSLAVSRKFKDPDGTYKADFPSCVAFGKTAEFIGKYFVKGSNIGIEGRIQTGDYTNREGVKVYTTEVIVESAEFVGSKSDNAGQANNNTEMNTGDDDFMNIPDGLDNDELPFN